MDTNTWQRAQQIFDEAIQKPAGERAALVSDACAGDPQFRAQMEKLLMAHETAGDFLASPTVGIRAKPVAVEEREGARIGPYKLLECIGEGGFATVYMAQQTEPVLRKVALKIIKLGMDTKEVIGRFEAERQALAMMDHPNIAQVFDAGATDTGRPYFVMELVRGEPINEYFDNNALTLRERLALFMLVCHAVQHAHTKGIIHRDIKPTNVLVASHDGVPVPKVIDFGIAKAMHARLTDKTVFTGFRQLIGTPAYMSPEQAELSGLDIDTRSDVYSLGVLLYELLTGRTPFDSQRLREAPFDELRRIIREVEPPTPSSRVSSLVSEPEAQARPGASGAGSSVIDIANHRRTDPELLTRSLRGDLDCIVMKCLEKDRTQRYQSASKFAEDVQRYLTNQPILARPPSAMYQLQKLFARHKARFASIAAMLVILAVSISIQAARLRDERDSSRDLARAALQLAQFEGHFSGREVPNDMLSDLAQLCERQMLLDPDDVEWRFYFYAVHDRLFRQARGRRDFESAEFHADIVRREARHLVALEPENPKWKRALAFGQRRRGQLYIWQERYQEAYDAFKEESDIRETLLGDESENPVTRKERAWAYDWLAKCCYKLGGRQEEETTYRFKVMEIFSDLASAEPDKYEFVIGRGQAANNLAAWYIRIDTPAADLDAASLLDEASEALHMARRILRRPAFDETQFLSNAIEDNRSIIGMESGADGL